jgi:hypothetical protein
MDGLQTRYWSGIITKAEEWTLALGIKELGSDTRIESEHSYMRISHGVCRNKTRNQFS